MRKLFLLAIVAGAMACSDGSSDREGREAAADKEIEEDVDIGSGAEISPQLELDSTESRFEVDTISSPEKSQKESNSNDESF